MQIDCPTCARSYQVGRDALGATGRTVVCPACATRWHVAASDDDHHPAPGSTRGVLPSQSRERPSRAPSLPLKSTPGVSGWRPIMVGLACACLLMLVIGKRTAVVTLAPRTAALYAAVGLPVNIRGLEIAGLRTVRLDDGVPRAEISGRIRNLADAHTPVPRLTFDIRDAQGATLASWTENAPKRMLADNESVAFTTQSPALPEGTKDVFVRFDVDQGRDTLLIHKTR